MLQKQGFFSTLFLYRTQVKYIIPCHWDTMLTPIDQPPKLLPGVNIPEFLEEIKASGVEPLFMPILGELYFDQNNES